jgi:hypothetical protein
VGIGYKTTYYTVTYSQYFVFLWFRILINRWTETKSQYWTLITDGNGAEATYYPHPSDPAEYEASVTKRSYVNTWVFWEKLNDWGYLSTKYYFPYKK